MDKADAKLAIGRWKEDCGKRCAVLHGERCPDHIAGICKFPDTKVAKGIVRKARTGMITISRERLAEILYKYIFQFKTFPSEYIIDRKSRFHNGANGRNAIEYFIDEIENAK